MTFLPIVQRELRGAARRRSTFRVRWWTTVLALGVSTVALIFIAMSGHRTLGAPLFNVLAFYAFGLSLLAGVFLTADCLSEEKREGTLGLLFLTDLKGYDVVLGKLVATSVNACYCLLALLPVMALPLLLGGVTGAEYARMALALLDALFFSLAVGMCVSAFGRDSQRAMGNTLGLLFLAVAGLPVLAALTRTTRFSDAANLVAGFSPFQPFALAGDLEYRGHARPFWLGLAGSSVLGAVWLALASLALPRLWRERSRQALRILQPGPSQPRHARPRTSHAAELLARNPVSWLLSDEPAIRWRAWFLVAAWAVVVACVMALAGASEAPMILIYAGLPFGFGLKVLFAFQAGRFFAEGRRNGALELLLCTPLTNREIVRGQSLALWHSFLWPVIIFVILLFAPAIARIWTAIAQQQWEPVTHALVGSFFAALFTVRLVMDLLSVCWFGMALALTTRRPTLAPALTVLFVLILPSILSFCYLDILLDIFFISWGVSRLQRDIRKTLTQSFEPALPPVIRLAAS